jgi:hypothetical protein
LLLIDDQQAEWGSNVPVLRVCHLLPAIR